MNNLSVLVFGASGFIATYLVDDLVTQGYTVVASDINDQGAEYYAKKGVHYAHVDITRQESFAALDGQFDIVINLAACQPANVSTERYDPKDYINVNVIGTLNILEFCRKTNARKLIHASSHRNTEGLWAPQKAISEAAGRSLKYSGEYAMFSISETAAQDCIFHYHAQYGLNGIVFRLPPVYGYGPHTEIYKDGKPIVTGFQIFVENAKACRPLEVWGDWNVGRDIIYVKDVTAAFISAIKANTANGLYNITSGRYLTLKEQAETIAELFWGSEAPPVIINVPEKSNGIDAFLYDNERAQIDLKWKPKYTFRDMLLDYRRESESGRYSHLIEKRKKMLGI